DHGVDLGVQGVEQLAVVGKAPGLGKLRKGFGGALLVHVAQGDDVLAGHFLEVLEALAAAADDGQVELVLWRVGEGGRPAQPQGPSPGRANACQSLPAIEQVVHARFSSRDSAVRRVRRLPALAASSARSRRPSTKNARRVY